MEEFTADLARALAQNAHNKIVEELISVVKTHSMRGYFGVEVSAYKYNLDNKEMFKKVKGKLEYLGFAIENSEDYFDVVESTVVISWR